MIYPINENKRAFARLSKGVELPTSCHAYFFEYFLKVNLGSIDLKKL